MTETHCAGVQWPTLVAISVGGVAGAVARYGLDVAFPHRPDGFAWATFGINVSGCLLIGALMVLIADVVGTGLCGALTTCSTFGYETVRLLQDHARLLAVVNAAASIIAGLGAAAVGAALAQALGSNLAGSLAC